MFGSTERNSTALAVALTVVALVIAGSLATGAQNATKAEEGAEGAAVLSGNLAADGQGGFASGSLPDGQAASESRPVADPGTGTPTPTTTPPTTPGRPSPSPGPSPTTTAPPLASSTTTLPAGATTTTAPFITVPTRPPIAFDASPVWPPASGPGLWQLTKNGITMEVRVEPSAPKVGDTVKVTSRATAVGDFCCQVAVYLDGTMNSPGEFPPGPCPLPQTTTGSTTFAAVRPGPVELHVQATLAAHLCFAPPQFVTTNLYLAVDVS